MTTTAQTTVQWSGDLQQEGFDILRGDGGAIVSPTKVGYIIMTSDHAGLERKFALKHRNRSKPGVVLCGSLDELRALADLTPEIDAFYEACWNADILMGCILPWKDSGRALLPDDGCEELMMDARGTSCFVVKFGVPGEQIARALWDAGKFAFASSANESGKGNRGLVAGIGDRITGGVDLVIAGDEYVQSIQPDRDVDTRYAQGVMVSMVDDAGRVVPEQHGERGVTPCPTVIRKGLAIDRILPLLAEHFTSFDYRQGQYY